MTEFFRHKIIALHHPYEWPPRSPDLTPCDFFLWGYLKSKVYQTAPSDIQDLTQRIVSEADAIKQNPQLVKRAMRDILRRAIVCADNARQDDGAHTVDRNLPGVKFSSKVRNSCVTLCSICP